MKHILYLFTIYFLSITPFCHTIERHHSSIQEMIINTIYGDFIVTEPVLIDLFNHPIMERIKHIRQYGISDYIIKQKKEYTRYEHSTGVWALLRMFHASLEEQIAGLLHDTSHTVFSHVGDMLFHHTSPHNSYQDDIHEWYLKQYHIDELLAYHGIPLAAILHKNGMHKMLEQDLPNICADRLEYNLQAGILTNTLNPEDIADILKNIHYENEQWFFTDQEAAKKLALVSLYNTEHVWGNPTDCFIYTLTTRALQKALEINLLTQDDIHFSTDPIIWDKLWISNDPVIIECLNNIVNHKTILNVTKPNKGQTTITAKFRGLDPLVCIDNKLQKLTEIDNEYYKEYIRVLTRVTRGWGVNFTKQ